MSSELQKEQRRRWRESKRRYTQKCPQKVKEKKTKYNAEYYNKHKEKLHEKSKQRIALALHEAPPAMPLPLENLQVRRYHELQRAAGREPSLPRALPGFRERLVRRVVTIKQKFNVTTHELDHMTTKEVRIYEYI